MKRLFKLNQQTVTDKLDAISFIREAIAKAEGRN
jgi:hypothetical protein